MPISLTHRTFDNQNFVSGLSKLVNHPFRNQVLCYRINKIYRKWEEEFKSHEELRLKLLKQFAMLDENGRFIPKEDRPGTYQILKENSEVFKKAMQELTEIAFEIPVNLLDVGEVEGVELSPAQLGALESIFDPKSLELLLNDPNPTSPLIL